MDGRRQTDPHGNHSRHYIFRRAAFEQRHSRSLSGIFPKRQPVSELGQETPPAKPGELVIGQFESLLIVGNSIKAVEPIVAHLTGGCVPALNDNAVFAADKLAQFRDSPLYYGWFNAKTFFTVLVAHSAAGAESRRAQPDAAVSMEQNPRPPRG